MQTLFKVNPETLENERVRWPYYLLASNIVIALFAVMAFTFAKSDNEDPFDSIPPEALEAELLILQEEQNEFTERKMVDMLLDLNVKFPDIVLAQARYESANFSSTIWMENNNPFGMKIATTRPTTNQGENRNHAVYHNWKEAVYDYAFYQAAFTRKLKSRDAYFSYIKSHYAEGAYSSIYKITQQVRADYPELCVKSWPDLEK